MEEKEEKEEKEEEEEEEIENKVCEEEKIRARKRRRTMRFGGGRGDEGGE